MADKIAVLSLGCDKNRTDTEKMLYYLGQEKYTLVNDFSQADIIIVNTCAFIENARKEAIDNILMLAKLKEQACRLLIVTGCLPQKYIDEIFEQLPEVDVFLGTSAYSQIADAIKLAKEGKRAQNTNSLDKLDFTKKVRTTPAHYAYIKIAEGCDNCCTFCTIPSIRGSYKSKSFEVIIDEARTLIDDGVKEIILVAQDTTRYGKDIYGSYRLLELIKQISAIEGIEWLRVMYCYPEMVDDDLINEIANNPKIAKYIDIPLQHISDNVLKRMGRRSSSSSIKTLVSKLKGKGIAIRSTFMTGFPNETEQDFLELKQFLEQYKLEHAGFFSYSREQGTASYGFDNQVPKRIAKQRERELAAIQQKVVEYNNSKLIGKCVRVLYEDIDYKTNKFVGRTEQNAPSIDSNVYFKGSFADVGSFYNVRITKTKGYDLIGVIEENESSK